jgi:hypothetical protein
MCLGKQQRLSTQEVPFSENDLGLIRMLAGSTVGDEMILPSGLKTTKQVIKLTKDFDENVKLMSSIIDLS